MKHSLDIAGITVKPGEKKSGYAKVPGTDYRFPITIVNGAEDGKILLASAGIHGWEYPGILATFEAAKRLDPSRMRGAVVLPHIINISGFEERQPYVVAADEKRQNLNRLYPGDPEDTTLAGRIVRFTSQIASLCDFHIDLHSGDAVEDLYPIVIIGNGEAALREESERAARVTRFGYRMYSGGRTEYYNSTIIDHKKPSLLFERGGSGVYTRQEVEDDVQDILAIAGFLGIIPVDAKVNENQKGTDRRAWLDAEATGMFYPFVKAGDPVREGQKLYEIRDHWGRLLSERSADFDGMVFIVPRTLAIKKGDDTVMYARVCENA